MDFEAFNNRDLFLRMWRDRPFGLWSCSAAFIVGTLGGAANRKTPAFCESGDIVGTLAVCGAANRPANRKPRRKSLFIVGTPRRAANRAANRKPRHCRLTFNSHTHNILKLSAAESLRPAKPSSIRAFLITAALVTRTVNFQKFLPNSFICQ